MSRNTSRVPLLVVAAVILVVAAIGQAARDASRGLSLAERITFPVLGLGLGFLLFVGVLRFITRQGRKRIRKLRELAPGAVFYTAVGTPELRDAIQMSVDGVAPEIDLSPHPTLRIGDDGVSLWGDDRSTGAPACAWSVRWTDVGDVTVGEFNDHGIRHRAIRLAIGDSGDVPFVIVSEDLGGFAVGRKTLEEVKRVLRSHASRPSDGPGRLDPESTEDREPPL